jgi:hypothetical protein
MKTASYHSTAFGDFAPRHATQDGQGYITYHVSARYAAASEAQLDEWAQSPLTAVRNAAVTEIGERCLGEWRRKNP